ncbi:ParB/RepB/Spo0J family partition protein, partial [Roseateles cavernae]|uniref:ParB/RepB/Spo0J family partition protein n=1 Tax=Roseateles cavernae TaxID=3153578 RepID=UPI0032E3917B
ALHIPLGLLAPSPTNPRRKFDAAKLQELAESIRETEGVFQPILARPNPAHSDGNGQPRYEIVAGERRWRASKIAGMETVLALVRDLSDRAALQIQLKENVDRESLHELEEAEGIKRLMEEAGATAEEVGHMLSKSRRWVFSRLTLLELAPEARELFLADKFKATIAAAIATIPAPSGQVDAAEEIAAGWAGEPFSFRAAMDLLRKKYMLRLDAAPFDIAAPFEIAGPCTACPKRTGANADLFGEEEVKRGDMCHDRACFHAKTGEARAAKLQAARDAGHTVLSGSAAMQLMPTIHYLPHGHLWFDQPAPTLTTDERPLREIFGAKQRDAITVELGGGQIVTIVPEASAKKLLKAKGLLKPEPPVQKTKPPAATLSDAAYETPASAPAPEPQKQAATPLSKAQLQMNITARRSELFGQLVLKALQDQLVAAEELPLIVLRLAITELLEIASYEAILAVYQALGIELPESAYDQRAGNLLSYLDTVLNSLDGRRLGETLALCLVAEELTDSNIDADELRDRHDGMATPLADHFGLDLDAIEVDATDGARLQVFNEEARRLGIDPATLDDPDATQAWVRSQLSDPAAAKQGTVKYRNPATGETWSGRGLQPKWLKARLAEGGRLEDFLL